MAGYKTFAGGEEALAADVNSFLMAQTVARFASAAARTSQLAAPATGQLSSLDTRPGVLQYWNGSAWTDTAPFIQLGFLSGTTNANGDLTLTYPTAFAAGAFAPVLQNSSTSTASLMFLILTSTTAGCTFRCYVGTNGTAHANQSVQVLWIAAGYRP